MTFDDEMARARRAGVVNPENLPFLMRPEPGAAQRGAVLLVHGFTASPWEMRRFGEGLAAAGFTSLGVRLPGHGTTPEDLASRRYEEWLETVMGGYQLLAEHHRQVYGLGLSTGGLLLLALAEDLAHLDGLILLSPFLRLRHRLAPAAGLLRFVHPFQTREVPTELAPYYYARRPVNGVYQILRLLRRVRRRLDRVTTPALVISAEGDQTADVESARELFRKLGGRQKEFHLYGPEVPHILTTPENPRWRETLAMGIDFLRRLESGGENGG